MYDLIIVGGGPTGISCAIEAKKASLNYLIIEKGYLVNSIYQFPTNMTFFSTSLKLEIGDIPFISNNDKPTRSEALEYYRRLVHNYQLNFKLNEKVINISKNHNFIIQTSKDEYHAKKVIITTGYYDNYNSLNVEGENLQKVKHYYDDPHPYINKNIIVVGGANSACDVALETWSKGANVTMVVRKDSLYQGVKYWILPNIENRIKEGSIKAYFNSFIEKITETTVIIRTPEGSIEIDNDYVLAMTGYHIDFEFLQKIGIKFNDNEERTPIYNEETLESNIEGLYLAGVILSGLATSKLFIENTRHHGALIMNHLLKNL